MKKNIIAVLLVTLCSIGYGDVSDDLYTKCYEAAIEQVAQGDLEGARDNFKLALGFKPDDANARKGLEMTEARLNKQPAAIAPAPVAPAPVATSQTSSKTKESKDFSIRASLGTAPGLTSLTMDHLS
jgi:hypothetical protein